jgi:hypothetical protein
MNFQMDAPVSLRQTDIPILSPTFFQLWGQFWMVVIVAIPKPYSSGVTP